MSGSTGKGIAFGTTPSGDYDKDIYDAPSGIENDYNEVEYDPALDDRPVSLSEMSKDHAKDEYIALDEEEADDPFKEHTLSRPIAEREDDYHRRRANLVLSPERRDPFASNVDGDGEDGQGRQYADIMRERNVEKERVEIINDIEQREREQTQGRKRSHQDMQLDESRPRKSKRSRWDSRGDGDEVNSTTTTSTEAPHGGPGRRTSSSWDVGPSSVGTNQPTPKQSRWDETPTILPTDETPVGAGAMGATPAYGSGVSMISETITTRRWERELDERNRILTDEEIDELLPEGYELMKPPEGYTPKVPARRAVAPPTPMAATPLYQIPEDDPTRTYDVPGMSEVGLPSIKQEDLPHFQELLDGKNEEDLSIEEIKKRKIMKLLLKVKNGTPPMRKSALRQITERAKEFGPGPLFNSILPLLMSPTLEDQERHLLVKVVDRVLYKLDYLVRPYVHKILVVILPLLIDEDYYARVEGREIVANLSKAAGLATMIATMKPDIDNVDEYVRNTTARAFSVVASALGIPSVLPFLKAVCTSKKSWQAKHTGIKIIQQIAILMGCAVLPHLTSLVKIIENGLEDDQTKVRTITALAISALAESSYPYGIESFDTVLRPLYEGIRKHRGKTLAAFLKAVGFIIPLMDAEYANHYTRGIMIVLIKEFKTNDNEMKKIVLKVVRNCITTEGVSAQYIRDEILPDYFRYFWVRRMALDKRNYSQLVETTVYIAEKVGSETIIEHIVGDLRDESEPYRRMVMETITNIIKELGTSNINPRLEERLIDGILFAYQEQSVDENDIILNGFGTIIQAIGRRAQFFLPQIIGIVKFRLKNRSAKVRMQAADLIAKIAHILKECGQEALLNEMGIFLYENLGEQYPEVLVSPLRTFYNCDSHENHSQGSILGALKAIVNVIGMERMTPPIKELLPRLTPILKNRHEKVQENCIDLVGRIADRGAEFVNSREWMRICFELLELLKAHKKSIRRATVNTFGYIAKAIGPGDVLTTLLNNLKVQERQMRVCTTIAIAIVAETCSPFIVLPALLNEYRTPELNVQNGVLKALSFLFEYISEMGKDYIYATVPLIEDALIDRDQVHRQTACAVVKHMALGVQGLGCEDAFVHLLNFVWPNVLETSPHVINSVLEAVEGIRVTIGPAYVLLFVISGLFHPARKVREIFWRVYNNMYVGSSSSLVEFYPLFPDEGENTYMRNEMLICL